MLHLITRGLTNQEVGESHCNYKFVYKQVWIGSWYGSNSGLDYWPIQIYNSLIGLSLSLKVNTQTHKNNNDRSELTLTRNLTRWHARHVNFFITYARVKQQVPIEVSRGSRWLIDSFFSLTVRLTWFKFYSLKEYLVLT